MRANPKSRVSFQTGTDFYHPAGFCVWFTSLANAKQIAGCNQQSPQRSTQRSRKEDVAIIRGMPSKSSAIIQEGLISFLNPSQWSDISRKRRQSIPDSTLSTEELWINSKCPAWVEADLASLKPGRAQSDLSCRRPNRIRIAQTNRTVRALQKQCVEGKLDVAVQALENIDQCGVFVSHKVLYCLLQGCIEKKDLAIGRRVHAFIARCRQESNAFLGSHLIRMFASCDSLAEADRVFSRLPEPNMFTWSAIISAHAKHGHCEQAYHLFKVMQKTNIKPDEYVFVAVLKACTSTAFLACGKLIHAHAVDCGFESDIFVGNTLISMYANCGSLEDAFGVFQNLPKQNVVTWNAMIAAYSQYGNAQEGVQLFQQMQLEGMMPNNVTYVGMLKGCSNIVAAQAKFIHIHIIDSGWSLDAYIGSSLIDVYAKQGSLRDARRVFEKMPERDVVTWSTMIGGYAQHGYGQEALILFQLMQGEGGKADNVTFVSMLKACSSMVALDQGKRIHGHVIKNGCPYDMFVGSALIDMYANCGRLVDARKVFDELPERDVATWNAIIGGCTLNSSYRLALHYFWGMQVEGLMPDEVTFVCLLSACSHLGFLDEGLYQLESMIEVHGIIPTVEHYNCMIDLLGRSGCLSEAENLLNNIPMQPTIQGWMSLLSNCKTYRNVEVGRRSFDSIVIMDHRHASAYVLMSSIYLAAGMWEDATQIQELRKHVDAWKKPGKAFIEVDQNVHEFVVGDKKYPRANDIYLKLKSLLLQMNGIEHLPQSNQVLHTNSDKDMEDALCGH